MEYVAYFSMLLASSDVWTLTLAVTEGSSASFLKGCYERLRSKNFFALLVTILLSAVDLSIRAILIGGEATFRLQRLMTSTP